MKRVVFAVLTAASALWSLAAQQTPASGISGTWQIEYHDKNGVEVDTPKITLQQSGGKLGGVFGNQDWKVEGTVSGDAIVFWFHPPQRPDITVKYQGRLENKGLIRGTMASEVQSGTFTAVRK